MVLNAVCSSADRPPDRYEKRHKNLAAHVSPAFRVELGDTVTVGEYARFVTRSTSDAV